MNGSPSLQLVPFLIVVPLVWAITAIMHKIGYSRWLAVLWSKC